MTMALDVKSWIFGKLNPAELIDLAYEFGRQYPIEALRGVKDAQAARAARVTVDVIINEVGHAYHVQPKFIYGQGRQRRFVAARNAAAEFMRSGLNMSLSEIGIILGGRDHTTIMHSLETVDRASTEFQRAAEVLLELGLEYA